MHHPARSYINPGHRLSREATGGDEPPTTPASKSTSTPTSNTLKASRSTAVAAQPPPEHKMLFSDLYKNPRSPLSKLRHSLPHPVPPLLPPGLDDDLVSRDKAKQKEAVKRYLADRVRCDWEFDWPPQQIHHHHDQTASAESAPTGPNSASADQVEPNEKNPDPAAVKAAVDAAPDQTAQDPDPYDGISPVPTQEAPDAEFVPKASGDEADSESDAESVYSTVSEDAAHYRPRADWTSDLSDNDAQHQPSKPILSPFRFDSPDSVGVAVQSAVQARRARRRREIREESCWNNGLACYNARRDAWTGARTVRVKPRATPVTSPVSPISPRRLFWRTHSRSDSASSTTGGVGTPLTSIVSAPAATTATSHHAHPLSPTTTHASNHSSTPSSDLDQPPCHRQLSSTSTSTSPNPSYPVETLLPLPPPLIPPQNPMRASITPAIYPSLYDKVVVHSLQPSCPVNLSDMVSACVAGWKRDGEWPPRSAAPPYNSTPAPPSGVVVVRRKKSEGHGLQHARSGSAAATNGEKGRRMSFGFLGGGRKSEEGKDAEKEGGGAAAKEDESGSAGKGIRRSLQKVFLGLGHHHGGEHGQAGEQHHAVKEGTAVM